VVELWRWGRGATKRIKLKISKGTLNQKHKGDHKLVMSGLKGEKIQPHEKKSENHANNRDPGSQQGRER